MLNHSGSHSRKFDQKSVDTSNGVHFSRGRQKRDEHEVMFLERLRTAYELAHLGGFERVIPLPPNIDPITRDHPKVREKWELFQRVGKVETSLNRSSKTHQNRLAEVQRKKREREEKQVSVYLSCWFYWGLFAIIFTYTLVLLIMFFLSSKFFFFSSQNFFR